MPCFISVLLGGLSSTAVRLVERHALAVADRDERRKAVTCLSSEMLAGDGIPRYRAEGASLCTGIRVLGNYVKSGVRRGRQTSMVLI